MEEVWGVEVGKCTLDFILFAFFKVNLAGLISKEPYLVVYLLKEC